MAPLIIFNVVSRRLADWAAFSMPGEAFPRAPLLWNKTWSPLQTIPPQTVGIPPHSREFLIITGYRKLRI